MPNDLEDLFNEMRDAGVQDAYIERIQKVTEASPLRKELKEAKDQITVLTESAGKYRQAALASQFAKLDIAIRPEALNVPSDLDPLDTDGVREWAVGMGLAKPAETTPAAEQQAHQRMAGASDGGDPTRRNAAFDQVLAAPDEASFWAAARAAGAAQ